MSECTTCSYYGKHLEGRAEDMPWPCVECAGGEKYVERGKRKHQVPLRVQIAPLLARHNALREAVKAEIAARNDYYFWRCNEASSHEMQEKYETLETARAEVSRLINMSHKELKF